MELYLRLAWRNIWRHRRRTVIIVLAATVRLLVPHLPGRGDD